jgi:hypothetical protein
MISYQTDGVEMPSIKKRETTEWIKSVAATYGKRVGEIAYIFCSDEKILEVNRQYLHHAEPEGEYSRQSQGYFKSCFGRGEGGVDEFCEYLHITHKNEFAEGHDECDDEECYPDVI